MPDARAKKSWAIIASNWKSIFFLACSIFSEQQLNKATKQEFYINILKVHNCD
jgi:hypothetical protein